MSNLTPAISILIPNYNKAPFLSNTLNSILNQSFTDWECIIVDDHSTDESEDIIKKFTQRDSRFKFVKRPDNIAKGGNACRNIAFSKAVGEFVIFFDSDDWFVNDALEKRKTNISKCNVDFIVNQGLFWNGKDKQALLITDGYSSEKAIDCFFAFQPLWLSQSLTIRRSFLLQHKVQWDESVPFYQDVLFNINLLLHSQSYHICEDIDWVWLKSDNQTLGNKAIKINSYDDNSALAEAVCRLSASYHRNHRLWFRQYCLKRFYDLLLGNPPQTIHSALMAYPDVLAKRLKLNVFQSIIFKSVAKTGIAAYRGNNSLGKSVYYRVWKKLWMKHIIPTENKHFLIKKVNTSDYYFLKALKPNNVSND
jgi:glycosyltransferase involved in cell wall biosynthesis